MLYPVLPIFLTQNLKAGGSVVGLIEGIAQATQQIVMGFSGSLSDRLQKRKSIALVGYILAALSKPLIGMATVWQCVLGARFLDRFGSGVRSAPRDALIAASAEEQHRGKAFGLDGIGDNLGAFLVFIITYLGFAFSSNIFLISFLFILYGSYQGIFRSVGKALASDLVPEQLRASGIGWYNTTIGLSTLFASIIAGQLWDRVGHPAVFLWGATFALAGTLLLLIFRKSLQFFNEIY